MENRRSDGRPSRFGRIFSSLLPMQSRVVRAEEVPPPSPVETKPAEPAPSPEESAVQFEMIHREWQNISMQ
ncbi:TOM40-1, partial [Symbiodinium pilosum]